RARERAGHEQHRLVRRELEDLARLVLRDAACPRPYRPTDHAELAVVVVPQRISEENLLREGGGEAGRGAQGAGRPPQGGRGGRGAPEGGGGGPGVRGASPRGRARSPPAPKTTSGRRRRRIARQAAGATPAR